MSICLNPGSFLEWVLPGSLPERYHSTKEVSSEDPYVPTAIVNNYFDTEGLPVRISGTGFVGRPGQVDLRNQHYGIAAGSFMVDWTQILEVTIAVFDLSRRNITVVSFLSDAVFA